MKKKFIDIHYFIPALIFIQLLLALITMHDMATAQGIGLYVAIQCKSAQRLPFDILVDMVAMAALLLALILPHRLLPHKGLASFFRLMAAYFAFLPKQDLASLIHLFDGHNLLRFSFDLYTGFHLLSVFLREMAPVLIILFLLYKNSGFDIQKRHLALLVTQGALCIGMLILPELSQILMHSVCYILLLVAYDWWEHLCSAAHALYQKILIGLIFALLFGRGCYLMLDMMNHYHL
ncbi:MAG: hypothetical protein E7293_02570 [Lachnospiraceae bacterium]|nr:hypothetical protein [Lachnospiraceae bacterium]